MVKRIINAGITENGAKMRDVAELAGVSQATVSYVLNAKSSTRISPETRRRVLDAADTLSYRPNAIARAMVSGQSKIIGTYQPHEGKSVLAGFWTNSVIRGISEALHIHQFHLLLYGYRESEEPQLSAFMDGRVDGLIVLAPHKSDTLPRLLAQSGFPTAIVSGDGYGDTDAISVDADNVQGAFMATEYLIHLGHTRIALLIGPEGVPNAEDRREGFEAAILKHNIEVPESYRIQSGFSREQGEEAAIEALKLTPRPTALLAPNDIAALGALNACTISGLKVPEDVSIVGFDNVPYCELSRPTLTTVAQPAVEMGRAAAEMMLNLVSEDLSYEQSRTFPLELVIRESTGPPPAN